MTYWLVPLAWLLDCMHAHLPVGCGCVLEFWHMSSFLMHWHVCVHGLARWFFNVLVIQSIAQMLPHRNEDMANASGGVDGYGGCCFHAALLGFLGRGCVAVY